MKKIQELLHARGVAVNNMRALIDKADEENRDLTTDEQVEYDKFDTEQKSLKNRADRLQAQNNLDSEMDQPGSIPARINLNNGEGEDDESPYARNEYRRAFFNAARRMPSTLEAPVLNALQVGTNSEGGFIVPTEFETMIVEHLQDWNQLRPFLNVITTAGDRNIPIEDTLGSVDWLAEEGAYGDGSDPAFGQVILGAHKLGRIIRVSEELLEDAFFNLEAYLARNFGKRFGLAEEAAFVAGSGSGRPTGIVVGASNSGVVFASATAITSDELIDVYHGLLRPYRRNATWLMNDNTVSKVRKLKDGDSQYMWQPGLQAGQPDMLLNRPLIDSPAMPDSAATLRSVVFGDLKSYTVADRSQRVMQRLNELYAANGQVGFRMRSRLDGNVTDSAGIVYAAQAA